MKKGGIGGLLINIGGKSRRVFYSCLPTDISPLIRTGWFHYAFALTFLSLAFFQKRFDTNDFNLIKDIVLSLFHVSPVAPWNLHETIDPTNPSSSFLVKSLLSYEDYLVHIQLGTSGIHTSLKNDYPFYFNLVILER